MTIEKYFFQKKTCQKNLPIKLVKKNCEKKNWKSTFFLPKIFFNGHFEGNDHGE